MKFTGPRSAGKRLEADIESVEACYPAHTNPKGHNHSIPRNDFDHIDRSNLTPSNTVYAARLEMKIAGPKSAGKWRSSSIILKLELGIFFSFSRDSLMK
jgi:hypothetical protein